MLITIKNCNITTFNEFYYSNTKSIILTLLAVKYIFLLVTFSYLGIHRSADNYNARKILIELFVYNS